MEPKRRSTNFTTNEKSVFYDLIEHYKLTIENKKTDGASNKEKVEAWRKLANSFCALAGTHRTVDSLKLFWSNSKRKAKMEWAKGLRVPSTDVGLGPQECETETERVLRMMQNNSFEDESYYTDARRNSSESCSQPEIYFLVDENQRVDDVNTEEGDSIASEALSSGCARNKVYQTNITTATAKKPVMPLPEARSTSVRPSTSEVFPQPTVYFVEDDVAMPAVREGLEAKPLTPNEVSSSRVKLSDLAAPKAKKLSISATLPEACRANVRTTPSEHEPKTYLTESNPMLVDSEDLEDEPLSANEVSSSRAKTAPDFEARKRKRAGQARNSLFSTAIMNSNTEREESSALFKLKYKYEKEIYEIKKEQEVIKLEMLKLDFKRKLAET